MKKDRDWVDYANLAANIAQVGQLNGIKCSVDAQNELQSAQLALERCRVTQEEKESADILEQDRLREAIAQGEWGANGLQYHLDEKPQAVLAMALGCKNTLAFNNLTTARLRAWEDKDRLKLFLITLDQVIDQASERLSAEEIEDARKCVHYQNELPELLKIIPLQRKRLSLEEDIKKRETQLKEKQIEAEQIVAEAAGIVISVSTDWKLHLWSAVLFSYLCLFLWGMAVEWHYARIIPPLLVLTTIVMALAVVFAFIFQATGMSERWAKEAEAKVRKLSLEEKAKLTQQEALNLESILAKAKNYYESWKKRKLDGVYARFGNNLPDHEYLTMQKQRIDHMEKVLGPETLIEFHIPTEDTDDNSSLVVKNVTANETAAPSPTSPTCNRIKMRNKPMFCLYGPAIDDSGMYMPIEEMSSKEFPWTNANDQTGVLNAFVNGGWSVIMDTDNGPLAVGAIPFNDSFDAIKFAKRAFKIDDQIDWVPNPGAAPKKVSIFDVFDVDRNHYESEFERESAEKEDRNRRIAAGEDVPYEFDNAPENYDYAYGISDVSPIKRRENEKEAILEHAKQELSSKMAQVRVKVSATASDDDEEGLIQQCIEIIQNEQQASISLLQRRLRLGYTRASHIMNELEKRGIVGPGKGAEPRAILIALDDGHSNRGEQSKEGKPNLILPRKKMGAIGNVAESEHVNIKNGIVHLTGNDTSCEVFADGGFVGNIPAKLSFAEGLHVICVKKSGFQDYEREIKVTAGSELSLCPIHNMSADDNKNIS